MSKISTYQEDLVLTRKDFVIGTDGDDFNRTKNFPLDGAGVALDYYFNTDGQPYIDLEQVITEIIHPYPGEIVNVAGVEYYYINEEWVIKPTPYIPPPYEYWSLRSGVNTVVTNGYLYNKLALVNIAQEGWRVLTEEDWTAIGTDAAALKLITVWAQPNEANNSTGFSAFPSGNRSAMDGSFENIGSQCSFWTDELSYIQFNRDAVVATGAITANQGMSVRLCRAIGDGALGEYLGTDGKRYPTVVIGDLEIMAVNLAETLYNDETAITNVTDPTAWIVNTEGAYCAYDNTEENALTITDNDLNVYSRDIVEFKDTASISFKVEEINGVKTISAEAGGGGDDTDPNLDNLVPYNGAVEDVDLGDFGIKASGYTQAITDAVSFDSPIKIFCEYRGKLYGANEGTLYFYDETWYPIVIVEDTILSLAVYKGKLYAGGSKIYSYDFDTDIWEEFYSSLVETSFPSLCVYRDQLFAGAESGTILVYNGSWSESWDASETIGAMCTFKGRMYAATLNSGNIYEYDGFVWSESFDNTEFVSADVTALFVFKGKLYAGGFTDTMTLYEFDGEWTNVLELADEVSLNALAVYNNRLYLTTGAGNVYAWDRNVSTLILSSDETDGLIDFNGNLFIGGDKVYKHGEQIPVIHNRDKDDEAYEISQELNVDGQPFIFNDIEDGKIYPLDLKAFMNYKILSLILNTDTGTVEVTLTINGVALDDLTDVSATSVITTFSAITSGLSTQVEIGDLVELVIGTIVDATQLNGTLTWVKGGNKVIAEPE